MQQYCPLSLNPESIELPSLDSPINLVSGHSNSTYDFLCSQNQDLKRELDHLMHELETRKTKNESFRMEISRQEKKISSWKNCYERAEEEYCMKVESISAVEERLKELDAQELKMRKSSIIRMACDEDESEEINHSIDDSFKLDKKISAQQKSINYLPKFNRVSSIALERKKSKRKQALSLTHLHRNIDKF